MNVLLALLVIFVSHSLEAQNNKYRLSYYTMEEGLSQNMVDCIFQDSWGFMWFGTWNGLNRFDGYSFKIFQSIEGDNNSLSNNLIHDIVEDNYRNLWIATADGLNVYLYEQDRFIHYRSEEGNTILSSNINTLLYDGNGYLWVGTDRGMDRLTIQDNSGIITEIKHYTVNPIDSGSAFAVNFLYKDLAGRIWMGLNNGVVIKSTDEDEFSVISIRQESDNSPISSEVQTIIEYANGIFWIGTRNGLCKYDERTGLVNRYTHINEDPGSIIHNSIKSLATDTNGNLIIATLGGISIYDGSLDVFNNLTSSAHAGSGLNNEFVNSLYTDSHGNVWIGTERGGINKYNIFQYEFDYLVSEPGNSNSISENTINSIWEEDEALWIGTAGGGLNRLDKKSGEYQHYRFDPLNEQSLPSDFVTAIHRDVSGNLWIGTWGSGVCILKPGKEEEGVFRNYVHLPENPNSIINNYVSCITEDRHGKVWIGTYGGLVSYDPSRDHFERHNGIYKGENVTKIGCLNFDDLDNMWVGTEEGLFRIQTGTASKFSMDPEKTVKYINEIDNPASISGNYIISIYDDSFGNIWFGTYGDGLNKLVLDSLQHGKTSFTKYTRNDGLSNNIVYGILDDNRGNLWLSTDDGLSRLNISTKTFSNYSKIDGLLGNQFYWSASFKNSSGKLFFGSMDGLLSFFPEKIINHQFEHNILLTDLRIYGQYAKIGEKYYDEIILDKPIFSKKRISLSHKIKEFTIDYSALHYEHPEKVKYAYILDGFDPQWRYTDHQQRYASYTNLKGGHYTFRVKSVFEDESYESEPLSLDIIVIPPFWVKPWFIIITITLVIALMVFYYRYRIFKYRQHQKELESLVNKRTAQIQGQNEQLEKQNIEILQQRDKLADLNKKVQQSNLQQMRFFTHMSHEFRTPLTLIIAPIEQIINEINEQHRHYEKLILVKRNARRLLHLINQLMEVRRIKTGNVDLKISKGDISAFLKSVTHSFSGLASQRKMMFEFHSYPETIETYFDHEKLENIIYNLLSNAFKYTPDEGQIIIDVNIVRKKTNLEGDVTVVTPQAGKRQPEKFIEINVMDTGFGIEPNEIKNIFKRFYKIPVNGAAEFQGSGIGLYLTRELIKTHKGYLLVNSKHHEGTTFTVLLPHGREFYSDSEISQTSDPEQSIPKLHIDLLSEQMQVRKSVAWQKEQTPADNSAKSLVLIIDDDADMKDFTKDVLSKRYNVITATNGIEGLEILKSNQPDIIISDIMMPGMDGLEFCSKVTSDISTSHIPIILLTSKSEIEDYLEGLEVGAIDYISKPFNIQLLESKVRNLLDNREKLKKIYASNTNHDLDSVKKLKVQDHFLNQAVSIIEDNLNNSQFGVKELAKELCVSRSLLHKKLSSSVDLSANSFINSIRLKRAAILLLNGDKKISEIAFEVGYNDPKYFSKTFRKFYGQSPSEFVEVNVSSS